VRSSRHEAALVGGISISACHSGFWNGACNWLRQKARYRRQSCQLLASGILSGRTELDMGPRRGSSPTLPRMTCCESDRTVLARAKRIRRPQFLLNQADRRQDNVSNSVSNSAAGSLADQAQADSVFKKFGGPEGIRTPDLLTARHRDDRPPESTGAFSSSIPTFPVVDWSTIVRRSPSDKVSRIAQSELFWIASMESRFPRFPTGKWPPPRGARRTSLPYRGGMSKPFDGPDCVRPRGLGR